MVNLKRRQVLLAAVSTGVIASLATDRWRIQADRQRQAKLEALAEAQRNPERLLQQAFQQDTATIKEIQQITNALQLTPPKLPYDREISKLLVLCSKLATQQYLKGKIDATYDGTLKSLPAYQSSLDHYKQIASFKGLEESFEESVDVDIPVTNSQDAVEQRADQTKSAVQDRVREAVKLVRKVPVYYGFVLSSNKHNIIIFRGTQRTQEWIDNLLALQEDYLVPDAKQPFGKTHQGFSDAYTQIRDPLPPDIAKQLDPSIPCYVSGHSLGAALATFAAIDIALKVPKLRSQLQLYTYAGPRVGDAAFAKAHSQLIPNSYRVVNLADVIPLVPPTKLRGTYVHLGQEWAFLSQSGDVLPNHIVSTYLSAIKQGLESNRARTYPNASI